jgi:hypothetical protein
MYIDVGRMLFTHNMRQYFITIGVLPGVFALPAGLGDVAVGLTAPLIA